MKDQKADDPSQVSDEYAIMSERWDLMNAILGGTEAMRAAGEKHLPRHERESDTSYQDRLNSAVLFNQTEKTLEELVGKPFSIDPRRSTSERSVRTKDLPAGVSAILDDVDLKGNNIDVFSREWFREGLAKCFCHVLVEFPRKSHDVVTLEQERAAGLRPYWVLIRPERLIAARETVVNGVPVLTHARILESYDEVSGFSTVKRERIRVLEPGRVALYVPDRTGGQQRWILDQEWETGLPIVPIVTFYSSKSGFMVGKPRLLDLAEMNRAHWQSTSDQRHILTVARFPILALAGHAPPTQEGEIKSKDIEIGPDVVLYNEDVNSKYYYVEHSGKAIDAGRQDLKDLETQMQAYGGQFLRSRPGTQTATATAIETAEATSELSSIVQIFRDALASVLYLTALWTREVSDTSSDPIGEVSIDMGWALNTQQEPEVLKQLRAMRDKREISRSAFMVEMKRRGFLSDAYDPAKDSAELLREAWATMTPQDRTALVAELQADLLSWSEARAILKRAGLATLADEAAKSEIESRLDFSNRMPSPVGLEDKLEEDPDEDKSSEDDAPPTENQT